MKKLILTICLLLSPIAANAQSIDDPYETAVESECDASCAAGAETCPFPLSSSERIRVALNSQAAKGLTKKMFCVERVCVRLGLHRLFSLTVDSWCRAAGMSLNIRSGNIIAA